MAFALCFQTYNVTQANKRADMWHDQWKKDTDSLLVIDQKNRDTISHYECVVDRETAFVKHITIEISSGKFGHVEPPNMDECLKMQAPSLSTLEDIARRIEQ